MEIDHLEMGSKWRRPWENILDILPVKNALFNSVLWALSRLLAAAAIALKLSICVAGCGTAARYLLHTELGTFPEPTARGLISLAMAALVLGALASIQGTYPWSLGALRESLQKSLNQIWPAFVPTLLIALTDKVSARWQWWFVAGCAASAAGIGALRTGRAEPQTSRGRVGPWELGLLMVCVAIGISYLVIVRSGHDLLDNDAAYYYGVARHIVRTGRFEEPIVWHFLTTPDTLTHRPFDYWHGLSSLALIPSLLWGRNIHNALLEMALISGLTLTGFWYLICVTAPIRSAIVQLVALLTFAFSPAMSQYRFDTETVPFVHLWLVGALIALSKRWYSVAIGFAAFCFLTRPDTLVVAAIIFAATLIRASAEERPSWAVAGIFRTAGLFALGYMLFNYVLFRTFLPPGARLAPILTTGDQLYSLPAAVQLDRLALANDRLGAAFTNARFRVAFETLWSTPFTSVQGLWLILVPFALLHRSRTNRSVLWACASMVLLGGPIISWMSPLVFASWRTLHQLLPAFVLCGAYGADALYMRIQNRVRGSHWLRRWPPIPQALLLFLFAKALLSPVKPYIERASPGLPTDEMRAQNALFQGEPVMSNVPWFTMAYTLSPSVVIPFNGEQAIAQVLRRYDVRWLAFYNHSCPKSVQPLCNSLIKGTRTDIDGIPLERVSYSPNTDIFRVKL